MQLDLLEAEYVAHQLAIRLMDYGEPVPPFSTRYPGKLESCLAQPFVSVDGEDMYATLTEKASVLFYLVIKNHPFENGSKRMAVTLTLVFLFKNQKWIDTTPEDMYDIACEVAKSEPSHMKIVLKALNETMDKAIVEVPAI